MAAKRRREDWLEERAGSSNNNERSWGTLWKVPAPAKLKNFLWHLAKNSLPIEDVK